MDINADGRTDIVEAYAHFDPDLGNVLAFRIYCSVVGGGGSTFAFGCAAEIRDEETGEVHTWTIVGAAESDRTQGKLSAESPVATVKSDRNPSVGAVSGLTVTVKGVPVTEPAMFDTVTL